mmetsp:Transcript_14984/g.24389  ORF Transcript_14984/g.24389 Transcript_14984/m.24389 type:complete len:120 (-) Transcript_14984:363-722(-)
MFSRAFMHERQDAKPFNHNNTCGCAPDIDHGPILPSGYVTTTCEDGMSTFWRLCSRNRERAPSTMVHSRTLSFMHMPLASSGYQRFQPYNEPGPVLAQCVRLVASFSELQREPESKVFR